MEYIDYSNYPVLASIYEEGLDKSYVAPYPTSPDCPLAGFIDRDTYFDRPICSVEASKSLNAPILPTPPTTAQIGASFNQAFDPAPFGQLKPYPSGFPFDTTFDFSLFPLSPQSYHSPTPSLDGDGDGDAPQEPQVLSSPPLSPRPPLKRESTDESFKLDHAPVSKRRQRKRGRACLNRSISEASSASTSSTKALRTTRLPHNQVERKYREGLNAGLERLRRTVPTLPQGDDDSLLSQPRPSKAMILAGAIEYIKTIEKERDTYREENRRLRAMAGAAASWNPPQNATFPCFPADT